MQQEVEIEGMTCSSCASGIQKSLTNKGLEQVQVDLADEKAKFNNPKNIPEQEIEKWIKQLGYQVKSEFSSKFTISLMQKFIISCIFTAPLLLHMIPNMPHWLHNPFVQLALSLPVYLIGISHFGKSAWGAIRNGSSNMDVLIILGASAAFFYSLFGAIILNLPEPEKFLFFETAATIITLVLMGNIIERKAVNKTHEALKDLKSSAPDEAKIWNGNNWETMLVEHISPGMRIQLNEGDIVPVDGKVLKGNAHLNLSVITGESEPVHKDEGEKLIAGAIVVDGNLEMKALKPADQSTYQQIVNLVKNAQNNKPNIQKLGDQVSSIFVPTVIIISVLTFLINYLGFNFSAQDSLLRAVAVLVIACPCAMGLATPTAIMVGVAQAAKKGILFKSGDAIESFAKVDIMLFDKTGTLTNAKFKLHQLSTSAEENYVKSIIQQLESKSSHPIAKFLHEEFKSFSEIELNKIKEIKGAGMQGEDQEGNLYKLGSSKFTNIAEKENFNLYLSKNGEELASLLIADEPKDYLSKFFNTINKKGIAYKILTGDSQKGADHFSNQTQLSHIEAGLKPDQKLRRIEELSATQKTAMIGDGINDAPALAKATVGVSFGTASDLAQQSAGIIITNQEELKALELAHQKSQDIYKTIKQNLWWALSYNVIAIPLAAMGFLSPMIAAFSMAFSDVVVIGNSLRLRLKE